MLFPLPALCHATICRVDWQKKDVYCIHWLPLGGRNSHRCTPRRQRQRQIHHCSRLQCIKQALWCAPYPTIPGESYILAKACIAPNNSRPWRWGRGVAGAAMSSFPHRCLCSWRRRKCNAYFRYRKKAWSVVARVSDWLHRHQRSLPMVLFV